MVDKCYNSFAFCDPLKKVNTNISTCSYKFGPGGDVEVDAIATDSNNIFQQRVGSNGDARTSTGEPEKQGFNAATNTVTTLDVQSAQSKGDHAGGQRDIITEGPSRNQCGGDSSFASRLAMMEVALKKITHSCGGKTETSGCSDASNYEFVTGDKNVNYEKNSHIGIEGNSVKTVGGTELIMNSGQFTRDVQRGNWEVGIQSGEGKIYAATKLTFQVGTSTIVMEPNKITITADRIDLNP